ncbi:FabD/lysophospholipase-like protein [Ceratobasidium sp. AG-I]|nr:FabD/lysophospholipase-like protein [Ceratobasidium sp. AG-I]
MPHKSKEKGIRLLDFDGGGINVLSALIIVSEIMHRLQDILGLSEPPLPCDIFDLICGTGTGGLVAILLGRLRLPISTAIECYVEILQKGFVKNGLGIRFGADDAFSASVLERVIGEIVTRYCRRANARMIDEQNHEKGCKVMVCAMSADAIRAGIPTCIRTYRVAANQGPDCTIVEAARATMATPGMFKRAWIQEQAVKTAYIGGGFGCNNPTTYAIKEVEIAFPERSISIVLSVGSGQRHSASVPERSRLSQFLPRDLSDALSAIATDCERTNEELAGKFENTPNVYFRFNADQGMQDIDQSDLARLSEVQAHTQTYLKHAAVTSRVDQTVNSIANSAESAVRITQGNIHPLRQSTSRIGRCPPPSQTFTGREDILERMRGYFFDESTTERRLFWDVFYIDATSHQTASAGLTALAKAANAGTTQEEALVWLESKQERWLLVLNNADDPKLNLQQFFPKCAHGDILVTTRNQEMRTHTRGTGHFCRVGGMLPEDALELMLRVSPAEGKNDAISIATTLVEQFGYFALAIVQAGAYMHTTECGLAEYLKIFQKARAEVLRRGLIQQQDDHELSLFTSWEVSYRQLSARSTQLLHIISFFHHEGIMEAIFEAASTRTLSYEVQIPLNESQVATQTIIFRFLATLRTLYDEWNPLALKDLTRELRAFSLLDYDIPSCSYSMHPLVQEWSRATAPDATAMCECAAWVLALCVRFGKESSEDFAFRRRLLPHLLALDSDHSQMVPELTRYLQLVYLEAGYEKEYEALMGISLQASRAVLGNEHPTTLTCMQNLALAFWRQGRLEEAEALQTEGIELIKRVLGHEHPETLASIQNLALTYRDQKRWQEAEGLFLEVIEDRKWVIGAEHRNTLASMGELALAYWCQGRLSEAELLFAKVLETRRRMLGRAHPDTLNGMHGLASIYEKQGRLREAESLMTETLALNKQVWGESDVKPQKSAQWLEFIQQRIQSELSSAGDT